MKVQRAWFGEHTDKDSSGKVRNPIAPEGRISEVNNRMASIAQAPNVVEAGLGVRNIPPALVGSKAPDVLRHQPQHAQARAVVRGDKNGREENRLPV